MCGVFGFVSNAGEAVDIGRLQRQAIEAEKRGRHAFGFAWVDSRGRLRSHKSPGRISDQIDKLWLAADAVALIGHCRHATVGNPLDNGNNHPHPCDGGWIVHNGTVENHRRLAYRYDLMPSGECDSEILAGAIEIADGSVSERVLSVVSECQGPLVMMGLWSRPVRLVIARSGKPLAFDWTERSSLYICSTPGEMDEPHGVKDGTVRLIRRSGRSLYWKTRFLRSKSHVVTQDKLPF